MKGFPSEEFRKVLRERQLSTPFSFNRHLSFNGVLGTPETFPLFRTDEGNDTIINVFRFLTQDPFNITHFLRAGLRFNGKISDFDRDGCYGNVDNANLTGLFTNVFRGNGFVPANFISGSFSHYEFMYRAKPKTQISVMIQNYASVADIPGNVNVVVAGAVLT